MTEEEKQAFIGPVMEFVDSIETGLQPKLAELMGQQQQAVADLATALADIDWSPLGGIATNANAASLAISDLAGAASSAASAMNSAAANMANSSAVPAVSAQSGLSYVPYDNFPARLHTGERVLTATENKAYSGQGSNMITLVLDGNLASLIQNAEVRGANRALKIIRRNPRVLQ